MKILIIGGTGFLGSRLVSKLALEHQIAVLHRGKTSISLPHSVKEIFLDRLQTEKLKEAIKVFSPEVIIDLVAGTRKMAEDLVHACKGITKRIVGISSCDVYQAYAIFLGRETGYIPTPLTETSPLRNDLYLLRDFDPSLLPAWLGGRDYEKIQMEQAFMKNADVEGTILRLPMIYGPGDLHKHFFEIVEKQKNATIFLDEETAAWMGCWGYVDNVVEAIILATTQERASGQIYHLSNLNPLPYAKIVEQMGHAAGWQGTIEITQEEQRSTHLKAIFKIPVIKASQNLHLVCSKIVHELGFKEIISDDEAFAKTYKWLKNTSD